MMSGTESMEIGKLTKSFTSLISLCVREAEQQLSFLLKFSISI